MAGLTRMIRNTASAPDPAEIEIPRLADHPAYAAAFAYRTMFSNLVRNCDSWKQRLGLERLLADKPESSKSQENTRLRAQLTALQDIPPLPGDETAPESPGSVEVPGYAATPAVKRLLKTLDGAPLAKKPDHAERLAWIDELRADAWQAGADQQEMCDRIAGEVIFEYAQRLKPANDALNLEMYRAAQELSRAARRLREFRSKASAAGIQSSALAVPNVRAPLILGDESSWDSEISGWRRILESLGIL